MTVAGSGSVVLSPDQSDYALDTTVMLTATPDTGWQFDGWSGDLTGADNPASVLMDGNKTITATFSEIITPPTYTLSLISAGDGAGSIEADPDQPVYDYGTVVTLTATPDTGSHFAGWTGDANSADNPLILTMDSHKAITATFASVPPTTYTLTVNTIGNGLVSPGTSTYISGTVATLTATPDIGNVFLGWTGDVITVTNPITVLMTADIGLTATFDLLTYTLNLTTTGNGSGTISAEPDQPVYDYGTVVTLTATPEVGSYFAGWSGDAAGAGNPLVITMDSEKAITATFSVEPVIAYTLTVNTAGNGSVSPDSGTYISGTVLSLAATPGAGWQFDGWSGDLNGVDNPASVLMDSHKSITATFSQISPSDIIYLPLILK